MVQLATKGQRSFFAIRCEPHVSTRLKHIFPRISKAQIGRVTLAVTEETAKDLAWVLGRYPMKVSPAARKAIESGEQGFDQRALLAQQIRAGSLPPMPARALALPARGYQEQAAALAHATGALLVADDLGTGKTITAIRALAYEGRLPAVIVTLTHLTQQWARELSRFLPGLRIHVAKSGQPYDLRAKVRKGRSLVPEGEMPEVVIMNYQKVAGWAETLATFVSSLVFDEVQELRHHTSAKYSGCRHLAQSAQMVVGLSGTPIYGYGEEWWSVFDCIRPGLLGTREEFLREWCVQTGMDKHRVREPRVLGSFLYNAGVAIRRRRKDVRQDLQPLQRIFHEIDADAAPLADIESSATQLARAILRLDVVADTRRIRELSAEFSNTMRQATGLAKAPHVADFVRMLVESGERVILFGWHHAVYRIWEERLKGLGVAWYTGHESAAKKDVEFSKFIRKEVPILVMSLRAGAGLDGLQHGCRTLVFGELDWSPAVLAQCEGRLHRDGQEDPVVSYYLTTSSGADPVMLDVASVKQAQMVGVRDPGGDLVEEEPLDPDHVKKLAEQYLGSKN